MTQSGYEKGYEAARKELEAKKRKKQTDLEADLIAAYMAGNVGNGYALYAAAEMVNS